MKERKRLVKSLIEYEGDINDIIAQLSKYEFDSEPLVTLTRQNIIKVIEHFLKGAISTIEIEIWADAVEMRDDIEYEQNYEKVIADILFKLSEQEINEPITANLIKGMIVQLET